MRFEFATAVRILFGPGVITEAGEVVRGFGQRALLVTGGDTHRSAALRDILSGAGVNHESFPVTGEPKIATVQDGVIQARSCQATVVVACGGGSALDAGKAIAAMLNNPGDLLDYLEVIGGARTLPNPSAPFIAIPTTAGTGSEVTRNAVLASPEREVKVSLRSPGMLARAALVDPELTFGLPPSVTATTGLDALTQVIEPYVSARHNPLIDAICREGITRAARSLRIACEQPANAQSRQDMCLTSLFGGLALANAGLGVIHGFAGPIGGSFPAPHGAVCAALLPHGMAINIAALRKRQPDSEALRRYDEVARLLTGNPHATAAEGVQWLTRLLADLAIPTLGHYGITPQHIPSLVEKAAQASSMKANPLLLTKDELTDVLTRAL